MEATEIKKAWNVFKKEADKELSFGIKGCCYMTAKQIANGTATISLCNNQSYEEEIKYYEDSIVRISGYENWTDEEKERSHEYDRRHIAENKELLEKFGTKKNEAKAELEEIKNSNAFKKFASAVGVKSIELNLLENGKYVDIFQIRINY